MTSTSGGYRDGACGPRLRAALAEVAGVVEGLDADRFSGADAVRLTELFAWGERLCATGKAIAAKRVKDTGAWEPTGARSAAEWLANLSGQTVGQAAGSLDTARDLTEHPDVDRAARAGELSQQQSTAVGKAARKAPRKAKELVDKAKRASLAELRERSREIELAADERTEEEWYRSLHAGRYLRFWTDDDGAGRISGRFTPDQLAEIVAAVIPFQEDVFRAARRAGTRERRECHAADALVAMARAACSSETETDEGHSPSSGGPSPAGGGPSPSGGGPSPSSGGPDSAGGGSRPQPDGRWRRPERHRSPGGRTPATVIVRIDHAALVRGARTADECCEIDGIGPVPISTVRAMMTDAFLAAVVTDGIDIHSVVHLGRAVTATQRTALVVRDPTCVVPGCDVRRGLEIDHVEGWSATRVTTIDALARLCHHHHFQKTYEGWKLCGRPGRWRWLPPPGHAPGHAGEGTRSERSGGSPPPGRPPRGPSGGDGNGSGSSRRRGRSDPDQGRDAPVTGSLFDAGEDPFPP
jgi:hypothetical protein